MESMGEGRQVINMDYMSLYPEVRRLNEVNPDMTLRDFMVMRERDRRIQEELRESIEGMGETINKLTLNSIY
jgi:DNA polymerase elongation subunit (family B)